MIHFVKNIPIDKNVPENYKEIVFGAGCFWGVERNYQIKQLLHEIKCFFSDSRSAFLLATTLNMHECRNTQYSVQNKNKCPISSYSAHQNAEFS